MKNRFKLSRIVGYNYGLFFKNKQKIGYHGVGYKASEYALQMHEKNKVRLLFKVSEHMLYNLYKKLGGVLYKDFTKIIHTLLYCRLIYVLYNTGLFCTYGYIRQNICHGKVVVNNSIVTSCAYILSNESVVCFNDLKFNVDKKYNSDSWFFNKYGATFVFNKEIYLCSLNDNVNIMMALSYYSR